MYMTEGMRNYKYPLDDLAPTSAHPISKRGELAGQLLAVLADANKRLSEIEVDDYDPVGVSAKYAREAQTDIYEEVGAELERFIVDGIGNGPRDPIEWYDYMNAPSGIDGYPRNGDAIWALGVTSKDDPNYRRSTPSAKALWDILDAMPRRPECHFWYPHSEPRKTT